MLGSAQRLRPTSASFSAEDISSISVKAIQFFNSFKLRWMICSWNMHVSFWCTVPDFGYELICIHSPWAGQSKLSSFSRYNSYTSLWNFSVFRSFCLQTNIYWVEYQVKSLPVMVKKYVRNAKWLQVLDKWSELKDGRKLGQGKAAISMCVCVCAGRSMCLAACCLPENKQASVCDMNINLNVSQQHVWLSKMKQSTALSWSTSSPYRQSCCSSLHTQEPPPLPAHHAHVRLCCGCASFLTIHSWAKNPFDSFWVTKFFCC